MTSLTWKSSLCSLANYRIRFNFTESLRYRHPTLPTVSKSCTCTCVELIGAVLQAQEVIDHGRLSYTPWSQEQHHGFGGDLPIY